MKRCKSFLSGLIIGICISVIIPVLAEQLYEARDNQFPVLVNGKTANIKGFNIDGSTYFKLRDLGAYVGFDTDFEDGEILINTQKQTNEINQPVNSDVSDAISIIDKLITDSGIIPDTGKCIAQDGTVGYPVSTLRQLLSNIDLYWYPGYIQVVRIEDKSVLVDKVNTITINDLTCLIPEDFIETILPLDKK